MERQLTLLEEGVHVKISNNEFEKLKRQKGFLSREAYPSGYEDIAKKDEVGRFLFFRFTML